MAEEQPDDLECKPRRKVRRKQETRKARHEVRRKRKQGPGEPCECRELWHAHERRWRYRLAFTFVIKLLLIVLSTFWSRT